MPSNAAAWLEAKQTKLAVKPAPYTPPRDGEIVIKNRAVAINPVDWILQDFGTSMFPWLKCPIVLGSDVAGEVVEVGRDVARFRVGDRVLGHAVGLDKSRNTPAEAAFQEYTVLLPHMTAPVPDAMSFETASVLPLCLSTAACGLFQKDHLALRHPSANPEPTGEALIVWGGSTSVGSNAIQLAVAAGYEVITTASPKNFDYVRKLGASQVFDYKSPTVVADMIAALKGKTIAGALAIGTGSAPACMDVVHASKGKKFVSTASFPVSLDRVSGRSFMMFRLIFLMVLHNVPMLFKTRMRGIGTKFIFGSSLVNNEVGPMIYRDFLPGALADGRYLAAPEPEVVGTGLDAIQAGFDAQKKGVSARKIVVSL